MRFLLLVFLSFNSLLPILAQQSNAPAYRFPLKISENRRYFVDQANKPFFYHADTGW